MTTMRRVFLLAAMDNRSIASLGDDTNRSASSGLLVQSYCTQVAQQPAIVIPPDVVSKLPPINDQLVTAQNNAGSYLTDIQPKIIGVVTDVSGYAQQFNAFNGLITGKIDDWKGGSVQAKLDAIALLQQLKTDLDVKLTKVDGVRSSLDGFRTKLNIDISNFNTAAQQASIVIEGSSGAIASLDGEITDLNKRIGGAAAGIAISGLVIIGGALLIATGAIASFVTAGTSTPLVVAGVAVVAVGAAGLTASSIVLANLIKAKSDLLTQKSQLQATVKFLTDFKGTMGTLGDSATRAATELTTMSNTWSILGGNLGNVVGSIQNAKTYSDLDVVVQAYLNTASSQWGTVLTDVKTIQSQMAGVRSVEIKKPDGALGTLDEAALQRAA